MWEFVQSPHSSEQPLTANPLAFRKQFIKSFMIATNVFRECQMGFVRRCFGQISSAGQWQNLSSQFDYCYITPIKFFLNTNPIVFIA